MMTTPIACVVDASVGIITSVRKILTNPKRQRGRSSLTLRVGVIILRAGVIS